MVFTSGGTESINLAILGLAAETPGTILLTPGEHSATLEACRELRRRGWRLCLLDIDAEGRLVEENLDALPWNQVKLATIILAHNETGVVRTFPDWPHAAASEQFLCTSTPCRQSEKCRSIFKIWMSTALSLAAHVPMVRAGIGGFAFWREGAGLRAKAVGRTSGVGPPCGHGICRSRGWHGRRLERWQAERQPWSAKLRNFAIGWSRVWQAAVLPSSRMDRENSVFPTR